MKFPILHQHVFHSSEQWVRLQQLKNIWKNGVGQRSINHHKTPQCVKVKKIFIIKLFVEKHCKNWLSAKYIWYNINYIISYIAALIVGKWDTPDKEHEIIYTNSSSKHPLQDTSLQYTFFLRDWINFTV